MTFWSASSGGTQYTDLLNENSGAISSVVINGYQIPQFFGPDSITGMWAQASNGGSRFFMSTRDSAAAAAALAALSIRFVPPPTGVAATDSANIQAKIDLGGQIYLGLGTYVCNIQIKTGAYLVGAGINKTILQAPNSSSTAVITVPNFATLIGTDSGGGERQFAIRDLSVDGNRTGSATGRGIALYGYNYDIDNVHIYECGSDGFYSEWKGASLPTDGLESKIDGMHIHNNIGNGFVFDGPSDSQIANVMTWYNGAVSGGFHQNGLGFWVKLRAATTMFHSCHAYAHHSAAWKIEGTAHLINCQGEGADTQVQLFYDDCAIIGGQFYKSTGVGNITDQVGIDVGSTSPVKTVVGSNINTRIIGCTGGSLKFTNSGGGNVFRINGWQPSGNFTTGTPHADDRVDLNFHGQSATANKLGSIQKSSDTFGVTANDLPTTNLWSAHRGGGARTISSPFTPAAPENSMSAYMLAYNLGASIIDLDSVLTDDGIPVAHHDLTVDRTTQGTGNVSAYPHHALPLIDMREECGTGWTPETVPTIEAVLERFGRKVCLTIEPKNGVSGVAPLAALISRMGLTRSVFINCSIVDVATIGAAIVSAGCLLHVHSLSTVADVTTANTAGAWLIELPSTTATDRITAAQNATNIKRWISAPIFRRLDKAAMTAGFSGYVSDSIGYLERTDSRESIAPEITAGHVPLGTRFNTLLSTTTPALSSSPAGIKTGFETGNQSRNVLLGGMSGTKAATYTVTFNITFGAFVTDPNTRTNIRVACPSDEGTGFDADTRGYVIGLRKNGTFTLWSAPVGYGAATSIGTFSSTAIPDAGGTAVLAIAVTATTITATRTDTGHTTGAVANTDWRGDYIWIGGTLSGTANHDLTYTNVTIT